MWDYPAFWIICQSVSPDIVIRSRIEDVQLFAPSHGQSKTLGVLQNVTNYHCRRLAIHNLKTSDYLVPTFSRQAGSSADDLGIGAWSRSTPDVMACP